MISGNTKRKYLRQNIILVIAVILGVLIAFMLFYDSNVKRISAQNESYITDITTQRAKLVRNLFDENIRYIESASLVLETEFKERGLDPALLDKENEDDIDSASVELIGDVLERHEDGFAFNYLRFIDLHGRDYTTHDKVIQAVVTEREYFIEGSAGKTGMTYILDSKVTSERQIGFYAPVKLDDEIIGVVVGFYGEEYMKEILSMSMFAYDCEVLLCDSDGTVIYNTFGNENFADYIKNVQEDNGNIPEGSVESVKAAFNEKKNITFEYSENGERTVGCIAYIGDVSDLFIVMDFPASAFRGMLRNSNINGVVLLTSLTLIFIAVAVFYVIRFFTQRKRIVAEAKNSNDIHSAMSLLFENFIIVDADTGRYDYIEGMPEVGEIPNVGDYSVFVDSLLKRIPNDDERNEAAGIINFENIISEMNEGRDVITVNLHAPIREEEWFTYNFIVVERKDGKVSEFIIARQDITALERQEEETRRILKEARDEAEAGSRAKSDFLANMSHDIRTPMNAVIGYTNIARDHIDDIKMVEGSLEKISSSSQYLLSLINDILDMSKIESGKLQISVTESDLNEVFGRIRDITMSLSEDKMQNIVFDTGRIKNPYVKIDELRFEQVLINIISNAVKYTPGGGDIRITAEETGKGMYVFTVKDTGIGISPEFLPRIFESFSREKSSRIDKIQGTGLGMAITARLVEMMGGTINASSEPGKGSTFTVGLKLETYDKKNVEKKTEEEPEETEFSLEGCRVLLTEDNDVNADIATFVLSEYGVHTDRACNGKECIDIITGKGEGYYNAVLMDIQMPVMNGYEAVKALRSIPGKYYAGIPVIAMSANAYDEDVKASLESGMNAHIAKPFDPDELISMLKKHIRNFMCQESDNEQ